MSSLVSIVLFSPCTSAWLLAVLSSSNLVFRSMSCRTPSLFLSILLPRMSPHSLVQASFLSLSLYTDPGDLYSPLGLPSASYCASSVLASSLHSFSRGYG